MAVYLVRRGNSGPVKIGLARDVKKRVAVLQTAISEPLIVLRVLQGDRDVEQMLHQKFASLRLRAKGEWFTFHDDMMGDLGVADGAAPEGDRPSESKAVIHAIDEYRQKLGLPEATVMETITAHVLLRALHGLDPTGDEPLPLPVRWPPPRAPLGYVVALLRNAASWGGRPSSATTRALRLRRRALRTTPAAA